VRRIADEERRAPVVEGRTPHGAQWGGRPATKRAFFGVFFPMFVPGLSW
jgi:hypothetical protein